VNTIKIDMLSFMVSEFKSSSFELTQKLRYLHVSLAISALL